MIKCVGCAELLREELDLKGKHLVTYNCPSYFPYACALSGLLRPGSGITEAVKDCPERLDEHCILCLKTDIKSYGESNITYICSDHDQAWGDWLASHTDRRAYLAPKGRLRFANWFEVFREFIEDMRQMQGGII